MFEIYSDLDIEPFEDQSDERNRSESELSGYLSSLHKYVHARSHALPKYNNKKNGDESQPLYKPLYDYEKTKTTETDTRPSYHKFMSNLEKTNPDLFEELSEPLPTEQLIDMNYLCLHENKNVPKIMPDEALKLSRKYEKYLTIDNDEIVDKNDKIDALILQLKLPHIYTLPEDEQWRIIQEKYQWIDDDDGEVDRFQYEEIQEVVAHMTSIERRFIYDTIEEYDEVMFVTYPRTVFFFLLLGDPMSPSAYILTQKRLFVCALLSP